MDTVEAIEARKAKEEAVAKAAQVVKSIARKFRCDDLWVEEWVPDFRRALVGDGTGPRLTAHQIQMAYDELMDTWKSREAPKPAHILEKGKQYVTKPKAKRTERAPAPVMRSFTPEERERNKAHVTAIMDFVAAQEPEFDKVKREHGYDSPELNAVCAKHKRELREKIGELQKS